MLVLDIDRRLGALDPAPSQTAHGLVRQRLGVPARAGVSTATLARTLLLLTRMDPSADLDARLEILRDLLQKALAGLLFAFVRRADARRLGVDPLLASEEIRASVAGAWAESPLPVVRLTGIPTRAIWSPLSSEAAHRRRVRPHGTFASPRS